LPRPRAYHEIWLDGEKIAGLEENVIEPIYGATYLPRKFKIAVAVPPSNDVDVFAHDLGFIAILDRAGKVKGYNVTVGGGIRSRPEIRATLGAGADKTSLNTDAVQNPALIRQGAKQFGAQCIVLAIDARSNATMPSGYEVFIHGGRTATGKDVLEWAQQGVALGAGEILLTSMDRDGTQQGYDLAHNAMISSAVSVPVIASGGVGTMEHFYEGLTVGGADAVLAASIFHFGQFHVCEVKNYLRQKGVTVRPC